MTPHDTLDIATLAERAHWVRGLARALVSDVHEADDVAQEAWLASLRSKNGHGSSWHAWIGGVVRNLVRGRRREAARRVDRELGALRPDDDASAAGALERLETHERLIAAVRELDEPYRGTVLMRYFDGLTPEDIARRTSTPVRTVQTRLSRALQQLRANFDRKHGPRDAWTALLVPFAYPRSAALAGAVALNVKLKVALLVALIVCAYFVVSESAATVEVGGAAAEATVDSRPESNVASEDSTSKRVRVEERELPRPTSTSDTASESEVAVAPVVRRGAVIDTEGRPRSGVEVMVQSFAKSNSDARALVRTDQDGSFVIADSQIAGVLFARHPGLVTVLRSHLSAESTRPDQIIVVADALELSGRVVSSAGAPIPAAVITLHPPEDLRARLRRVLDRTALEEWSVTSDEAGLFDLHAAPAIAGSRLTATATGFVTATVEAPISSRFDITFTLTPVDVETPRVIGRVVDGSGQPMPDVLVALVGRDASQLGVTERTNARGEFQLALHPSDEGASELCAVAPGVGAAFVRPRTASVLDPMAWPRPLEIVIDDTPLEIHGTVLDADGRPVANARLASLDSAGSVMVDHNLGGTRLLARSDIEQVLSRGDLSASVQSDEAGRFVFRGLLPRTYRIEAYRADSLTAAITPPIEAGRRDVEIRMPREDVWRRIAGVVVDGAGKPVAQARVWVVRTPPPMALTTRRGTAREYRSEDFETGPDGRFEFKDVVRTADQLGATPPGPFSPIEFDLASAANVEDLRVVVRLQCHVQVDMSNSALTASALTFENASGEEVAILIQHAEVSVAAPMVTMNGPLSEVLIVGDDAVTLVLKQADAAQDVRIPLQLVRGELNVIRP